MTPGLTYFAPPWFRAGGANFGIEYAGDGSLNTGFITSWGAFVPHATNTIWLDGLLGHSVGIQVFQVATNNTYTGNFGGNFDGKVSADFVLPASQVSGVSGQIPITNYFTLTNGFLPQHDSLIPPQLLVPPLMYSTYLSNINATVMTNIYTALTTNNLVAAGWNWVEVDAWWENTNVLRTPAAFCNTTPAHSRLRSRDLLPDPAARHRRLTIVGRAFSLQPAFSRLTTLFRRVVTTAALSA